MYGIAGERTLVEWSPRWLPGYQGASPVRIGNAASEQLQLDVYGEVMGALHIARMANLPEPDLRVADAAQDSSSISLSIWQDPDDGIWEVRGGRRNFTHSKIMAWLALDRTIRDAETYGYPAPLDDWRTIRSEMHATICEKGYDASRNTFTQSFGDPALDASLLLIPIVGFLPPEDPRVIGTVAAIEQDLLVDGFVLRYRTETGADGLKPGEGAFLPCSFWLAEAYDLLGRHDEATRAIRASCRPCERRRTAIGRIRCGSTPPGWELPAGVLPPGFDRRCAEPISPACDRKTQRIDAATLSG